MSGPPPSVAAECTAAAREVARKEAAAAKPSAGAAAAHSAPTARAASAERRRSVGDAAWVHVDRLLPARPHPAAVPVQAAPAGARRLHATVVLLLAAARASR